jgi:hypothetical protein
MESTVDIEKHLEISKLFVPVKTSVQMLEEIIHKHYRDSKDPRVRSIQKINKELIILRRYLAGSTADKPTIDLYYH